MNENVTEGWGGLNDVQSALGQNDEAAIEAAMQQYKTNKMIFDAFNSPEGALFLEHLRLMTIEQPSFVFASSVTIGDQIGVLQPEQQGMMREGQNSIYRYIVQSMEQAKKGPPQLTKENNNG